MDRDLLQKDVAGIFKVSTTSIEYWESEGNKPQIKYLPGIIDFLDMLPEYLQKYRLLKNPILNIVLKTN